MQYLCICSSDEIRKYIVDEVEKLQVKKDSNWNPHKHRITIAAIINQTVSCFMSKHLQSDNQHYKYYLSHLKTNYPDMEYCLLHPEEFIEKIKQSLPLSNTTLLVDIRGEKHKIIIKPEELVVGCTSFTMGSIKKLIKEIQDYEDNRKSNN